VGSIVSVQWEYKFDVGFHNGDATPVVEYRQRLSSTTNTLSTCLHSSSPIPAKKVVFPRVNRRAWTSGALKLEEKTLFTLYRVVRALIYEDFLFSSTFRVLQYGERYPYHNPRIQHLEPTDSRSQVHFCHWIISFTTFCFLDVAILIYCGVSITKNCNLGDHDLVHGIIKINFQRLFFVNVCVIIGDQLLGTYVYWQRLTGNNNVVLFGNTKCQSS